MMAHQPRLLVHDERTQQQYAIPIENNTIPAVAFKSIKAQVEGSDIRDKVGNGLRLFDPGLVNAAVAKSDATWV